MFDAYARYYDAFYADKDYAAEAAFVLSRLEAHGCRPGSQLDLGCGTGRHCLEFASTVGQVVGIDRSEPMIRAAQARLAPGREGVRFCLGDVRQARLGVRFDAVVALFHVLSYQTENADLAATFATAAAHLNPGGLFCFDFWHGPGVLSDPPAVRVRRLHAADCSITRVAEPTLDPLRNLVDVVYTITVQENASGRVEEFKETHRMRYLFWPEIQALAETSGFEPLECGPWMAQRPVGLADWYACGVLRRAG